MDLLTRTAAYIDDHHLIRPGTLIVVAFSAGRDSRVLLDILVKLGNAQGFQVVAANFDHQLRPESTEETYFAADIATAYQIPFYSGTADIKALSAGKNLQEVARRERFIFLRHVAAQTGASAIATAHHANDQAETVLLHLLRGAGLSGLSAMNAAENGIIRPLLFASQQDIMTYAEVNNLEFRQDMSNFSTKYLRNQIRLQLLPQLTAYNPRIVDALTTTADICGQEDQLLDDMAENSLAELWLVEENALNGPGFDRLPLALKRRVLRKAFCLFAGEKPELSFGQAQAIITLKDEQSTALVQGKLAYRRGHIYFDRSMPPAAIYGERIKPLRDAQWHKLAQWGWCYRISSVRRYNTIADDTIVIPASFYDKLTFRTRRDGDSVYSSGKTGKKKLKDLFIEEKLPKYVKNTWPLLLLDEEIIWVPYLYRREFKDEGEAILIKISKDDII